MAHPCDCSVDTLKLNVFTVSDPCDCSKENIAVEHGDSVRLILRIAQRIH